MIRMRIMINDRESDQNRKNNKKNGEGFGDISGNETERDHWSRNLS